MVRCNSNNEQKMLVETIVASRRCVVLLLMRRDDEREKRKDRKIRVQVKLFARQNSRQQRSVPSEEPANDRIIIIKTRTTNGKRPSLSYLIEYDARR
jgi:hypothetical protein